MKINTFLPIFQGFYGTIFQYNDEEQDIENYNEENNTDLNYDAFTFDYKEHNKRVSEKCVEVIERELQDTLGDLKIEFNSLISPRYYNYTNDIINVDIELTKEDKNEVIVYITANYLEEFEQYLKNNFTSGPGYVSNVQNDVETWLSEYLKEDSEYFEVCIGHVLEFILINEEFTAQDLYDSLDGENYIEFELA